MVIASEPDFARSGELPAEVSTCLTLAIEGGKQQAANKDGEDCHQPFHGVPYGGCD